MYVVRKKNGISDEKSEIPNQFRPCKILWQN